MSSPELRASDADRDRAAARLREGLADGRLTLDEFSHRVDAAHAARTVGDLDELTGDLPAGTAPTGSTRTPTRWSVAVMGGVERKRRWRVEGVTKAVAVMGAVELDLRQAELVGDAIEIVAVAVMGAIEIVVPEGVDVELTGFAFMGAKEEQVADVPPLAGAPRIRVRAYALMGAVGVRSKPRPAGSGPPAPPPFPPLPPLPR